MGMRFDLFDLQLFVAVAEARSLTRGADRSCISLAAASTRIKQMEESIGARLLYRNAQGVSLTPAGETLLYHARRVQQQLGHMKIDLLDHVKGIHGHVRIFANTTSITEYLPDALARFLVLHPSVSVDLREQMSQDVVRAVLDSAADIGIVAGNVHVGDLQTRPLGDSRLVLCVPAGHAFAGLDRMAFADTLDEQHVGLPETSATHGFLMQIAAQMGRSMKLRIQVGSFEAICRMIEARVGIGVVPEAAARRHSRTMAIDVVPLTDEWSVRDLRLIVRDWERLPTVARDMVDFLERFAREGRMDGADVVTEAPAPPVAPLP